MRKASPGRQGGSAHAWDIAQAPGRPRACVERQGARAREGSGRYKRAWSEVQWSVVRIERTDNSAKIQEKKG